jgi:uncharacterized protein (TIGR03437 family)
MNMRFRAGRLIAVFAAGALGAFGQIAESAGNVRSVFDSGLASSLLSADTIPASITSVTSASEFGGGFQEFAAGSWIEIKGTGLAETTRTWAGSDFSGPNNLNAPTSLSGVSVQIGNTPAFVYYISPTQLNVQVPTTSALTGPVNVLVTNPSGGQATAVGQKRATAPGILAPPTFNVGGKQYMVATFSDGAFVGNPGLVPNATFRTAKPGDIVAAYGVGFGPVTPDTPPGRIAQGQTALNANVVFRFGQTQATATYRGMAPNFVGLYQFNITVPDVPDGDQQINVTVDGQALQQAAMFLTVKR